MNKFLNILKDIRSGALPANEIPAFLVWLLRKSRRFLLGMLVIAAVIATRRNKRQ
jgi:hypothetical protein